MARLLRPRVLIPLLLLSAFLLGGWTLRNKLAADRQGDWVAARRGDVVIGVDVTGTLASLASDRLGPPQLPDVWDFKLTMLAPEGSEVKAGQPVLAFDTSDLQRFLQQKQAERDAAVKQIEKRRADRMLRSKEEGLRLAEAEARVRKSQLKLDAPLDIIGLKERKQAEIDFVLAQREAEAIRLRLSALDRAADAEIRLLQSRGAAAAAVVQQTQNAIRQMTVSAPREGTVVYVPNWRGEKKKVGDSCWKAERIVEIPDLTRMKAEGEVDEVDAGRVAVGQKVALTLDAHPDQEFHGTIESAGTTVQRKRGSQDPLKVLTVQIKLDRTDSEKMRPGMRFQGTVELARKRGVLLVPRESVLVGRDGPYTFRRTTFAVERVPLKLGRVGAEDVEIVGGLSGGERVLVARTDAADEEKR